MIAHGKGPRKAQECLVLSVSLYLKGLSTARLCNQVSSTKHVCCVPCSQFATEAALTILRIDDLIRLAPEEEPEQ